MDKEETGVDAKTEKKKDGRGRKLGSKYFNTSTILQYAKDGTLANKVNNEGWSYPSKKLIDEAVNTCQLLGVDIPEQLNALRISTPKAKETGIKNPQENAVFKKSTFKHPTSGIIVVGQLPVQYLGVSAGESVWLQYINGKIVISKDEPKTDEIKNSGSKNRK